MILDWQAVVVGLAVAGSAMLLVGRAYKVLRGGARGCGGGCGCPAASPGKQAVLSIEPAPPKQETAAK